MEPIRIVIIENVNIKGKLIQVGTYGWLFQENSEIGSIEIKNNMYEISTSAYQRSPIPPPSDKLLNDLDSCFGKTENEFVEIHLDQSKMYRILKCKIHGNFFLEDTRGGFAMYTRLIFLDSSIKQPYEEIWHHYHAIPDDILNLKGLAK